MKQNAQAILRLDMYLYDTSPIEELVCVVKILKGKDALERATAEVKRLNEVNAGKGVKYFRRTTRIV